MNGSKALRWLLPIAVSLVLVPLPALGSPMIQQGADLWVTAGDGMTLSSFVEDPIPAGFFCPGSAPFKGAVAMEGRPLAAEPAGALGSVDTIVHRLDNAAFDAQGVARTRIQMMALSLASSKPIETSCGRYQVRATLAGEQPMTEMKIVQKGSTGGVYDAPLSLNVRMVFEPVEGNANPRRELERRIDLGSGSVSIWSYVEPAVNRRVRVDTDGNGYADAVLPAASNFRVGLEPILPAAYAVVPACYQWQLPPGGVDTSAAPPCPSGWCPRQTCHCNPNQATWNPCTDPNPSCASPHKHCTWICVRCPQPVDPTPVGR